MQTLAVATALAWILLPAFGCRGVEHYDVLVRGGTLVDGTGEPSVKTDVGIREGKIAAIGDLSNASAAEELDAEGLVVSPGFIDVHSHTAEEISDPERRLNEGVLRMGVTTVVGGPDGGLAPARIRELIAAYEKQGIATNVAFYVGHNGIRQEVMKDSQRREPTSEELDAMRALVREGMELGAVGLSTGLMYEPGLFSKTDELISLAKEVAPFGGIFDSHVRDPGHDLIGSDREVIDIARQAGIPGKIAHEKAVGLENKGLIAEVIEMVAAARAEGLEITTDQYPYDGAATAPLSEIVVVPNDMQGEGFDLKQALEDPSRRARLKKASEEGIEGGFAWLKATGYSHMRVTSAPESPEIVGRYLSELAGERGLSGFDLVASLLESSAPVSVTLGAIAEDDVQRLLVEPWNMVASDGGYVSAGERGGHPRSAGTFPRVLGHYVRELRLLSLEEAIRKMTSLPAASVGLSDRGRLADGLAADITIFDAGTISDRSTWDEPHLLAQGVRDVMVNGVWVLKDGSLTGEAPGRFLRRGRGGR